MSDNLKLMINLIKDLLATTPVVLSSGDEISNFCEQNKFHKMQGGVDVSFFLKLLQRINSGTLYFVTDRLFVNYVFILIENIPVCIGPFCTHIFTEYDFITLGKQQGFSSLNSKEFLAYRSQFPIISYEELLKNLFSILKNISNESLFERVEEIDFTKKTYEMMDVQNEYENVDDYYNIIQNRYTIEQRFMKNIQKGNYYSAIIDFRNMKRNVAFLKQIGTMLNNEKVGAAIVRTLIRISALKAGLPASTIDYLSSKNTRRVQKALTVERIFEVQEEMIREFCQEIHKHQDKKYSNFTLSVKYYIDHQFIREDLTIGKIAEELNVSTNYLITKFRKEMDMTPLNYLRKVRMENASSLLISTEYSIQKISIMVGIMDANYFVKLFKKEYGEIPSEFRKYHKL